MSKINPNLQVEGFARDSRNRVVHILVRKTRAIPTAGGRLFRLIHRTKTRFSSGTGFVIKSTNSESIVLTANHVVSGMKASAGDVLWVRAERPNGVGVRQMRAHVLYNHRHADVAILVVPTLRNVQSLPFALGIDDAPSIIGVGFANPVGLFAGIPWALKRFPDLSAGSFMQTEDRPVQNEVQVTTHHMEMVGVKGMSGCPIVNAVGVVGMMICVEGAYVDAISTDSICQVIKQFHKMWLHQLSPDLSEAEVDATVNPWTIQQAVAAI